jgi:HK97 family phage major capsid protein
MASEFMELLRPATIIGQINGLRRVPFNIRVAGTLTGTTANWVGEGASKPVSAMTFGETLLGWAKAAGIVVITQELARFSDPSAEAVIRNDLRDTIAQFLDVQFITPSVAAVANVHPASITNGVTAIPSTGGTVAAVKTDIQTLFQNLATANLSPQSGHWITTPSIAIGLSMALNVVGQPAFPGSTPTGGTLVGFPVVVSNSVPSGLLIFVIANEIFLADDGDVTIDASQEASLQLDSAPATPPLSTALVSLWQQNLVGVRAERYINWAKRRAAAVQYISALTPASDAPAIGGGGAPARSERV